MKLILLGNAGSGKSTLARRLIAREPAGYLSLDSVAFDAGARRQSLQKSVDAARHFIDGHASWVIEGCYADIIEPLLPHCEELLFLNPDVETCVTHCRARPWEPEKFGTREEQDAHLEHLISWVRAYDTRTDEYGLAQHQALYDAFPGRKRELRHPQEYAAF